MGASTKDKRDIYYRQSKAEGYRARSAYKLIHLDEIYGFLSSSSSSSSSLGHSYADRFGVSADFPPRPASLPRPSLQARDDETAKTIIDLCAAPGSWSQVLSRRLAKELQQNTTLLAVDLQPMAPIPRILQLQGDITLASTAARLRQLASQAQQQAKHDDDHDDAGLLLADLIICDGAPDVHGLHILDEFLHSFLLQAALSIGIRMLKPGGTFIAKIFSHDSRPILPTPIPKTSSCSSSDPGQEATGEGRLFPVKVEAPAQERIRRPFRFHGQTDPTFSAKTYLQPRFETFFRRIDIIKPASSRASSAEHFIVCHGFCQRPDWAEERAGERERRTDPFLSNLWDSAQGRDAIASCLLERKSLPPSIPDLDEADEDGGIEQERRDALSRLLRIAAQG
ncbi:tRNA (uridine-2'-O-)-methyltransferase trm7 [Tilletia horrida]|nr:tRNA (uridine-2'-O-)-methyltransferase trm7 [Tilletia horrida]